MAITMAAHIEKLIIQGIGGIGPVDEDRCIVDFATNVVDYTLETLPLTVIQGGNESAKSTILDCLKYAVTGELSLESAR